MEKPPEDDRRQRHLAPRQPGLDQATLVTPRPVPAFVGPPSGGFTQFTVSAGLLGSLRLGLNPGEFVDFILGFFGADIYSDDVEEERDEENGSSGLS